jgi:hypothetical protein
VALRGSGVDPRLSGRDGFPLRMSPRFSGRRSLCPPDAHRALDGV